MRKPTSGLWVPPPDDQTSGDTLKRAGPLTGSYKNSFTIYINLEGKLKLIFDWFNHVFEKAYSILLQANPGVVTTLDNRMHGLQTGDKVSFKEIVGMAVLNGSEHTVKGNQKSIY